MASFSASIPTQRETLETNGAGDQNHNEDNKTKIKQGWQQKLSGKGNTNAPRCAKCEKIVYKMEEIVALGSTWHKSCFSCGATSDPMDGCNRILSLATYMDNKKKPYCKACFDRNFTPKGTGFGNSLVPPDSGKTDFSAVQLRNHVEASAQKSGSESSELDFDGSPPSIESPSANSEMSFKERWQTNANAAAERRKSEQATLREIQTGIGKLSGENTVQKRLKSLGAVSAPKCPVCSKSVYKMEEIVALGNTWHKSCFCCGAGYIFHSFILSFLHSLVFFRFVSFRLFVSSTFSADSTTQLVNNATRQFHFTFVT